MNRAKNIKVFSAVDTFYNNPTPANAIALAISDHRAYNKGSEIYEYTAQLHRARDIVNANAELVAALTETTRALQFVLDGEDSRPRKWAIPGNAVRFRAVTRAGLALAAAAKVSP